MGYYTRFTLKWSCMPDWKPKTCGHDNAPKAKFCQECGESLEPKSMDKVIGDYIQGDFGDFMSRSGESDDRVKWYEHEADMCKMSLEIPGVLFHLMGEGENTGDLWDLYALNGRVQKHKAEIVRKPFDPKGWS